MKPKTTDMQMKEQLLQRRLDGESVVAIAADTGIPRSTIYSWLQQRERLGKKRHAKRVRNLHWIHDPTTNRMNG